MKRRFIKIVHEFDDYLYDCNLQIDDLFEDKLLDFCKRNVALICETFPQAREYLTDELQDYLLGAKWLDVDGWVDVLYHFVLEFYRKELAEKFNENMDALFSGTFYR